MKLKDFDYHPEKDKRPDFSTFLGLTARRWIHWTGPFRHTYSLVGKFMVWSMIPRNSFKVYKDWSIGNNLFSKKVKK